MRPQPLKPGAPSMAQFHRAMGGKHKSPSANRQPTTKAGRPSLFLPTASPWPVPCTIQTTSKRAIFPPFRVKNTLFFSFFQQKRPAINRHSHFSVALQVAPGFFTPSTFTSTKPARLTAPANPLCRQLPPHRRTLVFRDTSRQQPQRQNQPGPTKPGPTKERQTMQKARNIPVAVSPELQSQARSPPRHRCDTSVNEKGFTQDSMAPLPAPGPAQRRQPDLLFRALHSMRRRQSPPPSTRQNVHPDAPRFTQKSQYAPQNPSSIPVKPI